MPTTSFSFEKFSTDSFQNMYRPMVTVSLWSPSDKNWKAFQMLVDTGADYTILPKYVAILLGLDLSQAAIKPTQGIGGMQQVYLVENIRAKIGTAERTIPVGFIPQAKAPALLGRHLFLETFTVEFKQNQKITFSS